MTGGKVDFCLKLTGQCKVFLEVKRCREELENHQEQLLNYAFRDGVPLAILTNGLVWWFYLPLQPGHWEQRKFFTLDLRQQEATSLAEHLFNFLERSNISEGRSVELAEQVQDSRTKRRITEETLPKAWGHLCEEPDSLLIDLVAEKVASLCGHTPSSEQVLRFLARLGFSRGSVEDSPSSRTPTRRTSSPQSTISDLRKNLNSKSTDTLEISPENPPNLEFTNQLQVVFGDEVKPVTNWASAIRWCISIAFTHGLSREQVEEVLNCTLQPLDKEKPKGYKGYHQIDGTELCHQNADANATWTEMLRLAKRLSRNIEVEFVWRDNPKATYPGRVGRIRWSPL